MTITIELILPDLTHLQNIKIPVSNITETENASIQALFEYWIKTDFASQVKLDPDCFSNYLEKIKSKQLAIGCFGLKKNLTDPITHQDRLEIYLPLRQDPKIRRQTHVKQQKKLQNNNNYPHITKKLFK